MWKFLKVPGLNKWGFFRFLQVLYYQVLGLAGGVMFVLCFTNPDYYLKNATLLTDIISLYNRSYSNFIKYTLVLDGITSHKPTILGFLR